MALLAPSQSFGQMDRLRQNCGALEADTVRRLKSCSQLLDLLTDPEERAEILGARSSIHSQLSQLAQGDQQLQQADLAIADSEAALAYFPDNAWYRERLASAHLTKSQAWSHKGDDDQALLEISRALQIFPDGWAYWQAAWIYLKEGEAIKAVEQYAAASEVPLTRSWTTQNRADALFHRARLLVELGRAEEAIADDDKALALTPYNFDTEGGWRCLAKLVAGRTAEAKDDCEKTIALQNSDDRPLHLTPVILLWLDRLPEAETVARKIQDMQHSAYASYMLGMVAEAAGDTATAEKHFTDARQLARSHGENFETLEREQRPYRRPRRP
jgi:tetratricopeptide (TPR) repeat protein